MTRIAVMRAALEAACQEMGEALARSAFSANIKERRDFSCALFDGRGRLVAQAEHIPVHLGSMEASVAAMLDDLGRLGPADVAVCNDPHRGGTHVPDVTMVAPVVAQGKTVAFTATRAHHADMGGIAPGSMPAGATTIEEEGLVIAPCLIQRRGRAVASTIRLLDETRDPAERRADFSAQAAACAVGARRAAELVDRFGAAGTQAGFRALIDASRRWAKSAITTIPAGRWRAEDALDDDGGGQIGVPLKVAVARKGDVLVVDFEGSAAQTRGNVNAPSAVTASAVYYAVKALTDPEIPSNRGLFEAVDVRIPAGSVLNPKWPAAVSAGNVETSQRVVDLVFAALAGALPKRVPAMSQGTMNNTTLGAPAGRRAWSYYETVGGGEGAMAWRGGMSGVQTHMTNTWNTPVEALEHAYPLRVLKYTIRRGSGGAGLHAGGDGITRELEVMKPAVLSLLTERRRTSPRGLAGGDPGARGRNRLWIDGRWIRLRSKVTMPLPAGTRVRLDTPGGGGWGLHSGSR